jgi:hypothetical protein
MSKRATKLAGLSLIWALVLSISTWAQSAHPVEGTYNVTSKSTELGEFTFTMLLKREAGKWMAEIKDAPMPLTVTSVSVDDTNKVTLVADAGGTAVTIMGKPDGNKLGGDWTAGDMKGTWNATRKDVVATTTKPADKPMAKPAAAAGTGAMADLEGTYEAKVIAEGQGELPFTLVIKRSGDKLVTEVPSGGDLNVTGIEVKDGDVVNLTATYQGNGPIPLNGKRNGSELGGKWEFGEFSGTWSAKKK